MVGWFKCGLGLDEAEMASGWMLEGVTESWNLASRVCSGRQGMMKGNSGALRTKAPEKGEGII